MAQVDLQVVTRGWHTTLLLSCWATFLLLVAVLLHVHTREITTPADVIVVLAGVAAAVATLIAQGEFSGMAGRLVGLLRAFAAVEASLPLIAASLFLFGGHSVSRRQWELLFLCVVAALITAIITISWTKARLRLRTKHHVTSPWEIAPGLKKPPGGPRDFDEARQQYGYQMPAIRVDTAEAWHHHFRWTKDIEAHAEALLSKKGQS